MSLLKKDKLNLLHVLLPEGAVVPSHWLQDQGYSKQLIYKYVKSGWLVRAAPGAYCRPGTELVWQGVVASWQHTAETAWHVGGETALNLQGHAHYLRMGREAAIHLYGQGNAPSWLKGLAVDAKLAFHARQLFAEKVLAESLKTWPSGIKKWPLSVSEPERALLEMMPEVADEFTFTHVAELMQSMTMLRPARVTTLLKACTHIKAKRLFLFLAEFYQHPWLKKVDISEVEIGRGKRSVVPGGKLDATYMITVPEGFHVRAG